MMEKNDFAIVQHVKELGQEVLLKLSKIQCKYSHIVKEVRFVTYIALLLFAEEEDF
jgi:hypothetical protein